MDNLDSFFLHLRRFDVFEHHASTSAVVRCGSSNRLQSVIESLARPSPLLYPKSVKAMQRRSPEGTQQRIASLDHNEISGFSIRPSSCNASTSDYGSALVSLAV